MKVPLRILAALCVLSLALGGYGLWRAHRALETAATSVRSEEQIPFEVRALTAAPTHHFQPISAPAVFIQAAQFGQSLFVAGPAGLSEYGTDGNLLHAYAVGQELPSSPLVSVTTGALADSNRTEVIAATADAGILAFDGRSFRQIAPKDAGARALTCMLATRDGHLLLGTKKLGVLVYDGKTIAPLHPTLRDIFVTALAGSDSDLWVGTLDRGVLHFHAGQTDSFAEAQGLPDRQVQAIALSGENAYVGTVDGVAGFDNGRFSRVLAAGVLTTTLLVRDGELLVGSEDQGILAIPLQSRRPHDWFDADRSLREVKQIFASGPEVFALSRNALYRVGKLGASVQSVLHSGPATLTDRNISALAFGGDERLWIGYFDRGLDILSLDSFSHTTHVEDDHVFCVNRVLVEKQSSVVDVATANGLVQFDPSGNQQRVLTRADGLIADHVTDVVQYGNGLALGTPAGVTFIDATGPHSMYAFQGLVNNHVYALGASGHRLMIGTLGGLSQIEDETVQISYTTASSGLKHNWITAVVPVGDEWMVGTYGAGVLGIDPRGHFYSFESGTAAFEINPNAMLVTSSHVLAGSLGKGLYVFDRASGRWFSIQDGLPSLNVTALAERNGEIYLGTDNGLVRIREEELRP